MTTDLQDRVRALEGENAELKGRLDARRKAEPPNRTCDVCNAPSGSWCAPDCTEAPIPPEEAEAQRRDDMKTGEMVKSVLTMLATNIDDESTKAKNYVECTMEWHNGMMGKLPFTKVAVIFFRKDGMSPHQRAELACREALDAKIELESTRCGFEADLRKFIKANAELSVKAVDAIVAKKQIVDAIFADLNSRSDFEDNLDDETQAEIKTAWLDIIDRACASAV